MRRRGKRFHLKPLYRLILLATRFSYRGNKKRKCETGITLQVFLDSVVVLNVLNSLQLLDFLLLPFIVLVVSY